MPDYETFPLWDESADPRANLDPRTLPVPATLAGELLAWAAAYDSTLDPDDPRSSGFASSADADAFVREGRRLADALAEAVGERWDIVYQPLVDGPRP